MAPQVWRVRDRATFDALRRRGQRTRSGPVRALRLQSDTEQPPMVAFAVGRKVGPAHVRNLLRRRLRAIVRELALPAGAYQLSISPDGASFDFETLRHHVQRALGAEGGSS